MGLELRSGRPCQQRSFFTRLYPILSKFAAGAGSTTVDPSFCLFLGSAPPCHVVAHVFRSISYTRFSVNSRPGTGQVRGVVAEGTGSAKCRSSSFRLKRLRSRGHSSTDGQEAPAHCLPTCLIPPATIISPCRQQFSSPLRGLPSRCMGCRCAGRERACRTGGRAGFPGHIRSRPA